ncbi:MAG: Hsp20/alpha crystallin family protein [Ignavibacteriaceae bacterium]
MSIVRFNPVRDSLNVEREFNRLFKSFGDRFGILRTEDSNEEFENAVWMPMTDIYEDNNAITLKADLPGINKEDVKISLSNSKLSISGERVQEKEDKDAKCHRIERTFGKYYRSFTLPEGIKEDKIDAKFKNGQLIVSISKSEEVKPKDIPIKVS